MESNDNYRDDNRHFRGDLHHIRSNRAVLGFVLVLIGLFLIMRNAGFFPGFIDHIVFSWPMLLVAVGLVMTISASEKTAGIIVMAVGGFFLIPVIFRETFHTYNMFWPLIFILIGILFIFTRRRSWHSISSKAISGDDYIDYVNVFSGSERKVISESFKGGKVTAVFGGIELDLTKAKLPAGGSELEIACVFGGASIIVPEDWFVRIDVTPILGGFSDSRKLSPGRTVDPSKQFIIKGTVVFGGGEIKSY